MKEDAKAPLTGKCKIDSYTYDAPHVCVAEARSRAYCDLVLRLRRGITYRIEERVTSGVIEFLATEVPPDVIPEAPKPKRPRGDLEGMCPHECYDTEPCQECDEKKP